MSAAWVAGSVRARTMPARRLGIAAIRRLAAEASAPSAVCVLARSPYGRYVRPDATIAAAQRAVADTLLWNLRVLAGWLPATGVRLLRVLAGWYELANLDEHRRMLGTPTSRVVDAEAPYRLGGLATAWPRLAATRSVADLRAALAASAWGDPGTDGAADVSRALRLSWADRVASAVPQALDWAAGGAALLLAQYLATGVRPPGAVAARADRLLGRTWADAAGLPEFVAALPPRAAWALRGVTEPAGLWQAEAAWWARVDADGVDLLGSAGFGPAPVVGAVALLAVDAWRVRAALELAGRGGADAPVTVAEVFDAVA